LVSEQQLTLVSRYSVLAAAYVALAQVACSTSHRDTPCPRNQPAFHLELTAEDGVLPDDTELSVGYEGILKEHYSLAKGGPENIDLCCAPGSMVMKGALPNIRCGAAQAREASVIPELRDASAVEASLGQTMRDASVPLDAAVPTGPAAIHCSIWTDNVADIEVTARGYAMYHRPFEAYVPDPQCGVETIDTHITLYRPEGGM
jgi:hypothetical protein